jgi:hypothetical protein
MEELRELVGLPAVTDSSAAEGLLDHHARILERIDCQQTSAIEDVEQARLIASMSPVSFGHTLSKERLEKLTAVTTHSEIMLAKLLETSDSRSVSIE